MTPYDPSYYLLHGQGERFRGLIEEGSVLRSDGLEAIYKDADAHKEAYCFADAFEDVKDRNMCIVVGGGDDIAPGEHMVMPLWNRLKEHDTVAVQKQITFDCDHCMCNVRMALAEYIAQFFRKYRDCGRPLYNLSVPAPFLRISCQSPAGFFLL